MLTLLFTKPHSAINPLGQNTVKYSPLDRAEDIVIDLKSAGSTASGFLGMKMVLASIKCFGRLSHHIIKLKILTRTLIGTARSCLGVRPSVAGAIDPRCDWIPKTVQRWYARTRRDGSHSRLSYYVVPVGFYSLSGRLRSVSDSS